MSGGVVDVVRGFRGRRVLVIGDAMLDSYLHGSADRLCREAPVPIVSVQDRRDAPGGAANAAANVAALGGDVRFVSVTGDDEPGALLRAALRDAGVRDDDVLMERGRETLAKQRVVADGQVLVRFDSGSTGALPRSLERGVRRRVAAQMEWAEVVLLSDYGYGVVTPSLVEELAEWRVPVIVDAKRPDRFRALRPAAVKPNYAEAMAILGERPVSGIGARADQVGRHAERLLALCGARMATVTLDSDGAVLLERGAPPYRTYARPSPNARAAGAGDTFAACLALSLAAGASGPAATEAASAAAAVAVSKPWTATCTQHELLLEVGGGAKRASGRQELERLVARERALGRRIVFTNGCFDILHRGHVTYLSRAKALGDVLIVGLNTDAGVRRLKGPTRPINALDDRAQVIEALSCVDYVVAFDEDTPIELIRTVRPDVFVKGGDYRLEDLPEASVVAELGGEVQLLAVVPDHSTTRIIERIGVGHGQPALVASAGRQQ